MRPVAIKGDVVGAQDVGQASLFARSPEHSAHACYQLLDAEGLGYVVVGAQLQPAHFVALFQLGCKHDDRRIRLLREEPHEVVAAHFRHHQVKEDEVGLFEARHMERVAPVGRFNHAVALALEVEAHHFAKIGFIVNYKNCLNHELSAPPCGCGNVERCPPMRAWLVENTPHFTDQCSSIIAQRCSESMKGE